VPTGARLIKGGRGKLGRRRQQVRIRSHKDAFLPKGELVWGKKTLGAGIIYNFSQGAGKKVRRTSSVVVIRDRWKRGLARSRKGVVWRPEGEGRCRGRTLAWRFSATGKKKR